MKWWWSDNPAPTPSPAVPARGGDYCIRLSVDRQADVRWTVFDAHGSQLMSLDTLHRANEGGREVALEAARAWIDREIVRKQAVAEFEDFEEWYGQTPETMQKTITTQKSYIELLETKLDEGREGPLGFLDPERITS